MLEILTLAVLWTSPTSLLGCPADSRQDLLPGVVAPMIGESPVWLVDGTYGRWLGPEGVKSIWVLRGTSHGTLKVRGRRIDGTETVEFRAHLTDTPSKELVITEPAKQSMTPSGASATIMQNYLFVSSYIGFPIAGCWELTAEVGGARRQIILRVE